MSSDFTPEQKRYLEGFVAGIQARGGKSFLPPSAVSLAAPELKPMGHDAAHLLAQDEAIRAGKKLVDQEKWKREEHPFDAYHKLRGQAARDEFPKPADNFRWRFYGLFYVAPAQNSYMCRLRVPNGILSHWQFAGVAGLAEKFGGGYAHVTTRANLQFREVAAKDAIHVVEGVQDLGLTTRGSGADNIRNVTGDATAGIDPNELIDTRPHAREWHFHILNQRTLYGLPRKFNVAFGGGGAIPTLEDTNDIGFQAVEIEDGGGVEPGVWFKLVVGGITGHRDLARETGAVVKPGATSEVADAIVRVFIAEGDRTNRTKARLKYVLERYPAEGGGLNSFLAKVEQQLGRPLTRVDTKHIRPRRVQDRQAHIGVHPQKQPGLFYLGVVLPVGKMSCTQMRALAALAHEIGDGDIRLTVWQNLLISGIPEARLDDSKKALENAGLDWQASSIRAGLIACTGSRGCRFSASDTKTHAEQIATWCERRVTLDRPVNIHLTGCHHSCAQHYIGDIGLIAARISVNDEGDTVDGYHIVAGGGFGAKGAIGRLLSTDSQPGAGLPAGESTVLTAALAPEAVAPGDKDDGAPWHDQTLPLAERMKLAEGRPLRRRMMAAMAQQDCGQCGYNCEDYSNAIASQAEDRLNLCVPGAKETARMLKTLIEEMGGGASDPDKAKAKATAKAAAKALDADSRPGRSRNTPAEAIFVTRKRLNRKGSEKATYHVEFDISDADLDYQPGDSFGMFPVNDEGLVSRVIAAIGAPQDFPVGNKTLCQVLREDISLGLAPDMLFELISYITGGVARAKAKALAKGEDPDGDAATLDVLAAVEKFGKLRPDPEAFVEVPEPLQPRLYSIASSHKAGPGRVALIIDQVRYAIGGRERLGVASTFAGTALRPGDRVKAYIQRAHHFALPADGDTPIIMVGPGTGVAPFRAFLQERMATRAKGPAWLFFGHQRRNKDFFYEDELSGFQAAGTLSKLSLAWSRDGANKVYVQDKMREEAADVWSWLGKGAHFYVCGDAKRMAADVDAALVQICEKQSKMDGTSAEAFVKDLRAQHRYQADVY